MSLPGEGFIALWNDIAPSRGDYNAWHTLEHVPERMTIDGFLRAYRYILSSGDLPRYFTLYALRDLSPLASGDYLRLVQEPTSWSRGMRPDMHNFIRHIGRTRITRGGGVGGYSAIGLSRSGDVDSAHRYCEHLSTMDGVSAVHFGTLVPDAEALKITVRQGALPFDAAGLFIVEGYDEAALAESCLTLDPSDGLLDEPWSQYKLAFELRKDDLGHGTFPKPERAPIVGGEIH